MFGLYFGLQNGSQIITYPKYKKILYKLTVVYFLEAHNNNYNQPVL